MYTLALSSSPKMEKGNTELILAPFIEGMRDGGADVELHYTERLNVNPCRGELSCMFKTPGRCFQDDDANWLAERARQADVLVLASPLYASGFTGTMKIVLDRLTALLVNPVFGIRDGHTFHPARPGEKNHKLVLVSSCAMWEIEKFDPLLVQMEAIGRDSAIMEFAGALLRPHSEFLRGRLSLHLGCQDVLRGAREAGQQLVSAGEMSREALAAVSMPLAPHRVFAAVANAYTRKKLRAAGDESANHKADDAVNHTAH